MRALKRFDVVELKGRFFGCIRIICIMGDNMTINVGSHTLSITKKVPVDESIVSYVYREYEPTNPAALNP